MTNIQTIIKEVNANKNSQITLEWEDCEGIVLLTSGQHLSPDDLCFALKNLPEEITKVATTVDFVDFDQDNLTQSDLISYYVDAGFDIDQELGSHIMVATWNR